MNDHCSKSDPCYFGPYQVAQRTKGGSYILAEMDGAQFSDRIAVFRLIPYIAWVATQLHQLAKSGSKPAGTSTDTKMTKVEDWELQSD